MRGPLVIASLLIIGFAAARAEPVSLYLGGQVIHLGPSDRCKDSFCRSAARPGSSGTRRFRQASRIIKGRKKRGCAWPANVQTVAPAQASAAPADITPEAKASLATGSIAAVPLPAADDDKPKHAWPFVEGSTAAHWGAGDRNPVPATPTAQRFRARCRDQARRIKLAEPRLAEPKPAEQTCRQPTCRDQACWIKPSKPKPAAWSTRPSVRRLPDGVGRPPACQPLSPAAMVPPLQRPWATGAPAKAPCGSSRAANYLCGYAGGGRHAGTMVLINMRQSRTTPGSGA